MLSKFDFDKNKVLTFEEFVQSMPGAGEVRQRNLVEFTPQPSQAKERAQHAAAAQAAQQVSQHQQL